MSYHRVGKFQGLAGIGGVLKDIGSTVGNIGGGLLDILGTPQQEQGRAEALLQTQQLLAAQQAAQQQQGGGFEKALPFIAIGGGALLIVLLASRKRKES